MPVSSESATLPPGPQSSPLVQTMRWYFRPLAFLGECREKFGETFTIKFIGADSSMVVVSNPDAVKALYGEPQNGMPLGRNLMLEPILGQKSILLLEGEQHLERRRLMLPTLHGERMRSYESTIKEIVEEQIDSWPVGEPFAILPAMQAISLEVTHRIIFGLDAGPHLDRLWKLLEKMLARVAVDSPAIQLVGHLAGHSLGGRQPGRRVLKALTATVNDLLYAHIAERRADPDLEKRGDMLSSLIMARFEDGGSMSDSELRDQLMTLLFAGYETTATALAWAFDLVLSHPRQLSRLRASLGEGREDYLRAAISETLRLRPVIPLVGRRLAKELTVDGFTLPAGTDVTAAIALTHARADIYSEPSAFRPERFLEEAPETYAWIPFGGGVRRCIGAAFSEFEMGIVLREVLTRCALHKTNPAPESVVRRNFTLSPRGGTPVVITARGGGERSLTAALSAA